MHRYQRLPLIQPGHDSTVCDAASDAPSPSSPAARHPPGIERCRVGAHAAVQAARLCVTHFCRPHCA
eukprot:3734870-Pleurochrysis_carterae.AAC.2